MRVVHWGTFDLGKPRARILRSGILAAGCELTDCHVAIWKGLEDKTQQLGRFQRIGIVLRLLATYPRLVWRFLSAPKPDLVLTSFPGVLDTIVIAPFARLRGVPLAWDLFISAYDTLVLDRRLIAPRSLKGRFIHALERLAIRAATLVFMDTEAHARRIEALFGLSTGSCGAVLVGAETDVFQPALRPSPHNRGEALDVLFYGQFIPLHGIEVIVQAARLMAQEAVHWILIGRGQEGDRIRRMLEEQPLQNVRWIEWTEYLELQGFIGRADLCLGIFGTSEKAACVIPNKVFQILACQRPVVTRDSPAIRELLSDAPPCVYLVPEGDAAALAAAVRKYIAGGRDNESCHSGLRDLISPAAIGGSFMKMVAARLNLRFA